MSYNRSPEMDDWVQKARDADCWAVLDRIRPGHGLKLRGQQAVGPCPACGGKDRFQIDIKKNLWICHQGGGSGQGGAAIDLVIYLDGADFLGACETINDTAPPKGVSGVKADPEKIAKQNQEAEQRESARKKNNSEFRAKEIRRAREIWDGAAHISGSIAETYLRFRGVEPAPGAKLRSYVKLPYWHHVEGQWRKIHEGPAMVAAIQGRDHGFIGAHVTYIDGGFHSASGKASLVDPSTGEILDAKKVRGSQKGGHIHLGGPQEPARMIVGEGIETIYSVREVLRATNLTTTAFWSSVNLGNLGGRAQGRVAHPSLKRTDKRGRVQALKVADDTPDWGDTETMLPPDCVNDILILGDGDSDRFSTHNTLLRAVKRWHKAGRTIRIAWADAGRDFNDMMRGAA